MTPAPGAPSDRALELLTVGRIGVDLYAGEPGVGWDAVKGFGKSLGGSAANVAVAAARLGHRAAVFTKVGADPFGSFLRRRLVELGVDASYVGTAATLRTALAFAVLDPPEEPPLLFYREPIAPDLTIESGEVPPELVAGVPALWITGTAASAEPSASTVACLLRLRRRRRHTVIDLDYRPALWPSAAAAGRALAPLLEQATVAVGTRAECEVVVGTSDPDMAADRLLERGVEMAVVKLGAAGALVASRQTRARVPGVPVRVRCGLGAGDGFGGALVHGLLAGWDAVCTTRFATAAGALVASRLRCADDMGTEAEISALLTLAPPVVTTAAGRGARR